MTHRMMAQDPIEVPGGSVRITDFRELSFGFDNRRGVGRTAIPAPCVKCIGTQTMTSGSTGSPVMPA